MKHLVDKAGLSERFEIASVATSTEEIGNDIYPPAKSCLRAHGIPFARRGARQITRDDYDYYDEIYVMDENNLRYLRWSMPDIIVQSPRGGYYDPNGKIVKLMSLVGSARDVADPWYTDNFERTYQDIVEALDVLLYR